MRPSVPHIYGKVKLEEDAFISCHHCDFTSYTFKGFSLHLRKVCVIKKKIQFQNKKKSIFLRKLKIIILSPYFPKLS